MNVRLYTKLFSYLALGLGVFAASTCFFPRLLFFGMLSSIVGTLISVLIIFTRTKYAIPTKWSHLTIISIVLCSVPVLYVLVLLFVLKR